MGGRRGPRRHPRTRHPRACPSAGRRGGARASPPRSSSLLRSRSRRAARWLDRDASSAGTGRAIDRTRRPPAATSSSATPRDRSAETRETWWGRFGRVRPGMPVPRALSRAWSSDLYIFARSSWLKERRNWWLKSVAISLFVATASQKKRVLEKKSIGASRAPEAFPFALRRASETLVTEEPPPTRLEEARVFLAGRVMYKIVSRVSIVSSSNRLIVSRKVVFPNVSTRVVNARGSA